MISPMEKVRRRLEFTGYGIDQGIREMRGCKKVALTTEYAIS